MKKIIAIILGVAGISALALAMQSTHTMNTKTDRKITITAGEASFTATLEDSAAAEAFRAQLPMTVTMKEHNGNEKYASLGKRIQAEASNPGIIRAGDLMLWGADTVVLFYETFSTSYRYACLGKIEDPAGLKAALGARSVTVTFAEIKQDKKTMTKPKNRVASDGATMQTTDPTRPTRVLTEGTRINMHFGETVIPGILNSCETAQALIARLPYTVRLSRYSHDFCGVMKDPLPFKDENVHYGWLNGDIDFATDANYFTILFEDEKNSERYGHQVNIGVIDCELSKISSLRGSHTVRIELAEPTATKGK